MSIPLFFRKREIQKSFDELNDVQQETVTRMANLVIKDGLMTSEMKLAIAGLILFADLSKYEG